MIGILIVALASGALEIAVESLSLEQRNQIATAVVKVTNKGAAPFGSVYIDCAFFDSQDRAQQTSVGLISNLNSGETAYASVRVVAKDYSVNHVKCRIGNTSD